jgi:hypothetical protein
MFDGAKSRQIAYDYVSLIDNVKILSAREKDSLGFKTDLEIWEIDTEISFNSKLIQIELHVVFTSQFPLEFPKIYLSPETFERTKHIPHVDYKRLVCTFDTEVVTTNPNEPAGIVVECIKKSKIIILDGLSGNYHSDFNDEFKAYWEEKYGEEKYLPQNILSLINKIKPEACLKLICLKKDIRIYKYVLHDSDEISMRFKSFLKEYDFKYSEVDVYYLEDFSRTMPPFDLKNRDILNFVKLAGDESFEKFKAFINNSEFPKLVVCEKYFGDKVYLFGWFHKHIDTNVNGFRPGALKQFRAFSTIQSNQGVNRVTTDVFTRERLENRTSGIRAQENEKSFLIAGVGSIGSNIIYFLNSMNSPEFRLVDSDNIRLENIQRHLLGFEYIGNYKTKAIKDYLLKNNPLQKVSTKESSIVNIVRNEADYLNDVDYVFIAIGKANIDDWICQSIKDGLITKPVFIIWVEPYLCGGHCLYLHPSNPEFEKYFEDDFFRFNVIDCGEYKSGNEKLSLREAGCQTTYVPYSGTNVISFISSLFPYISSIIDFSKTESKSFSWLGNIEVINEMGIKISNYYSDKNVGTIIEHTI